MNARLALFALVLSLTACKRPEDQAARQRIFSPEQPQGEDAKALQRLDARALADDAQASERVLRMTRSEIASRLGAHKLAGKTHLAWTRASNVADAGPTEVTLTEETSLTEASNGDFQASLQNDRNQGFEAVWAKGEVFVRSRFGPFRKRRTDRTDPQRLREHTASGLLAFDQLARGLKLRLAGETSYDGRRAVRYEVSGAGQAPPKRDEAELPPIQWPAGGPDTDTARRLSLWDKAQPADLAGAIVIDAETAAPLAWELRGHFRVAQGAGEPPAELEMTTTMKTSALGHELRVKAPVYEEEPSVPHAVKDPLRFLGKQAPAASAPEAGKPPAGTPEPDDDEEPAEEPGEEPAPAKATKSAKGDKP
jgi:hypothetical protein